jgi:hypothetical protein
MWFHPEAKKWQMRSTLSVNEGLNSGRQTYERTINMKINPKGKIKAIFDGS